MLPRSAQAILHRHSPLVAHARTAATAAARRPAAAVSRPAASASAPPASASAPTTASPAVRRVAAAKTSSPTTAATSARSAARVRPSSVVESEAPAAPPPASAVAPVFAAHPDPPATSATAPSDPFAPVAALPPAPVSSRAATNPAAASIATAASDVDWATSYHGLSAVPFTPEQADILMRPLEEPEIEIKPDGLLYLPEILYRRILNKAFGPGGWGMVPRGEMTVLKNLVTREWGLVAGGRLVSVARGEQTFFDPSGVPTASEGCKSNALMRCCKDLGIASELWDPVFIRAFKKAHCVEAWTEHVVSKKKQKRWRKKKLAFEYPYQEAAR